MKRWVKWVLGILGTVVVLVIGLVVAFDWNWLRGPAVNLASEKTGRSISVADLAGEWSLRPTIRLNDVHIANADWAKADELFAAERVEMRIDLPALLRGRLVLPEITLVKPDLALEMREDGTANWDLATAVAGEAVTPDERSEVPLIGRLSIERGRLRYKDPKRGLDLDGKLQTAEATSGKGRGGEGRTEVRLDGRGTLQGERFEISAVGGSLLSLREGDEPYPLRLDVKAVDSHATIAGTLADPITFDGVDLKVRLIGPNLARLTQITGVPLPLTPKYDLAARLERDAKVWALSGIDGQMGHSDLKGTLKIDAGRERLYLEADLVSKKLDYRDVGFLIGVPMEQEAGGATAGQKTAAWRDPDAGAEKGRSEQGQGDRVEHDANDASNEPVRVLPDAPLAAKQVREVDARVKFRGEQVAAPNVPLQGVKLDLEMLNGVLHLKPLTVGVAGGTTIADIRIDARDEPIRTDYDIRLRGYELREFLARVGQEGAGHGRIDGRIKLTGWGSTVRRSLGTSDGNVRLVMNSGEMSNLAVEIIGLDVAESLGLWAGGDHNVQIRCMVADLSVQNGLVRPRVFLLDTSDTAVVVEGAADVRSETMDLVVKAYPKDPSPLALRTPITLKGPFAAPKVDVQKAPLGARAAGAIALGVLLTPLASVLAFIEPGMSKDSDCAKLLQQVQAPAGEQSPNKVETPK